MHPVVLTGLASDWFLTAFAAHDGFDRLAKHQHSDGPKEGHVGQRDHQIQLPKTAQDAEEPYAERRPDNTRTQQD